MQSIWKFTLEVTGIQSIEIPKQAIILTVQTQNETPCIWAIVEASYPVETRRFETITTGEKINEKIIRSYIGTYQLEGGGFIGHLFEILEDNS